MAPPCLLLPALDMPLGGAQPPSRRGGTQTWVAPAAQARVLGATSACLLVITNHGQQQEPKTLGSEGQRKVCWAEHLPTDLSSGACWAPAVRLELSDSPVWVSVMF